MVQLTHTEQAIIDKLSAFEAEASGVLKDNTIWTKSIKRILYTLGCEQGYTSCASGLDGDSESEWLFDLVWYKEEGPGASARLVDIPLVMESEWNLDFNCIKYDFEKLLLANAPLRLMICQASAERMQYMKDYFLDAIVKYPFTAKDARFLIALLDVREERFNYILITNGVVYPVSHNSKQNVY